MGIFSSNQVKSNHNCLFPRPNPLCSALPALAPTPSLPPHYIHPPVERQHHSCAQAKVLLLMERLQASVLYPEGPSSPSPARLLGWLSCLHLPHPTAQSPATAFGLGWQGPAPHRKSNENQGCHSFQSIWKSSCCTMYLILSTSV